MFVYRCNFLKTSSTSCLHRRCEGFYTSLIHFAIHSLNCYKMARTRNSLVLISSIFSILISGQSLTISTPLSKALDNVKNVAAQNTPSCSCGVFLSGQFVKGSPKPPVGNPAIITELEDQLTCSTLGAKQCATKCLEGLVKYLPNSPPIICGSIDRDAYKERAYLFVNNCNNGWTNTNFSAGKEYCCKDGTYYKCPMVI